MESHRIRLNDSEVDLIVSALRARVAAASPDRARRLIRLIDRLGDGGPGNPNMRFGEPVIPDRPSRAVLDSRA